MVRVMLVKMLSISRRSASNLLCDILFFDGFTLVQCQMDSLTHKLVTNSQTRPAAAYIAVTDAKLSTPTGLTQTSAASDGLPQGISHTTPRNKTQSHNFTQNIGHWCGFEPIVCRSRFRMGDRTAALSPHRETDRQRYRPPPMSRHGASDRGGGVCLCPALIHRMTSQLT